MTNEELEEIERRVIAATPGPHEPTTWERLCKGGYQWRAVGPLRATKEQADSDAVFMASARTDVPALIARVRELEAECERTRIFGSRKFAELRAADVEQMRGYGLSYEGVRKVLREHDDGEISFGKLMDLIRAAARAMAEDMKK